MLYDYSFYNRKRDLTDVFTTILRDGPRFISNFRCTNNAVSVHHEYANDILPVRSFIGQSDAPGVFFIDQHAVPFVHSGTILTADQSPVLYYVDGDPNGNMIAINVLEDNGCAVGENFEELGNEEVVFHIMGLTKPTQLSNMPTSAWNAVQNVEFDIVVSGNTFNNSQYSSVDNVVNRQTAFALASFARDLNRVALFGRRFMPVGDNDILPAEAGGLYYMSKEYNAPYIDANDECVNMTMINEAARQLLCHGGEPSQIICSPGQARILTEENDVDITILRSDERRGAYVATIHTRNNQHTLKLVADPDIPDTDVWVVDPACFGLSLGPQSLSDSDNTPAGYSGIIRTVKGSLTFEFINIAQRCLRIKNLKHSAWYARAVQVQRG